jgi:hypothetical protein
MIVVVNPDYSLASNDIRDVTKSLIHLKPFPRKSLRLDPSPVVVADTV